MYTTLASVIEVDVVDSWMAHPLPASDFFLFLSSPFPASFITGGIAQLKHASVSSSSILVCLFQGLLHRRCCIPVGQASIEESVALFAEVQIHARFDLSCLGVAGVIQGEMHDTGGIAAKPEDPWVSRKATTRAQSHPRALTGSLCLR